MARVLIVGCGCRGRALAGALSARGHAVRGTTRERERLTDIEAAGAEAVVADPDRLGTVTARIAGVTALVWLMGTAVGEPDAVAALHGPRLESMLEALVDTPVRGFVYEAAGTVDPARLEAGSAVVRRVAETYRMPTRIVPADPGDHAVWLEAMTEAVELVLSA